MQASCRPSYLPGLSAIGIVLTLPPFIIASKSASDSESDSKRSKLSNSYTMGCPPVRGDNPSALASGLSYVQVDKHGITNLYHLY